MTAAWPASLPQQPERGGYRERPAKKVRRTAMDAGPKKQRREFTAGKNTINCVFVMDLAQLETFEAFWENDIGAGALPFELVHPRRLAVAEFKFTEEYEVAAIGGGIFNVACSLEEQ